MVENFKDLNLSEATLKGLNKSKYKKPTPIQAQTIQLALEGHDVLGAAKTGSGKTLAFLIPMLELLHRETWNRMDGLGALIITPTRELAYQIFDVLKRVGQFHFLSAGLVIGGKDLKFEKDRLNCCNIIVCTPGRLLQHMDENSLFQWDQVRMVVLDEADRILDLGFAKTMDAIFENLPKERQTLLFSATQTKNVKDLARVSLRKPKFVSVDAAAPVSTPENLTQSYIVVEAHRKLDTLWSFLKTNQKKKIMVFMATCKQVKYTYELFHKLRLPSTLLALYGSLHQLRRMAIYDNFSRKESAVLFATDVASRGLDFPAVDWVVQLDCPEDASTYIHRVGRTARFNQNGQSLIFLMPSEEEVMLRKLRERKIPIEDLYVDPKKMQTIRFKAQAYCAGDVALKESAQRAFKAYIKSIYLMKDKEVFNVNAIDREKYATSLGLHVAPQIAFLSKGSSKGKNDTETTEKTNDSRSTDHKEKQISLFCNDSDDEDGDKDLFTVKSTWRAEDIPGPVPDISLEDMLRKKGGKVVTKAAAVKKLVKKGIQINKKIVFDEEGKPVESFPTKQTSEKLKELEGKNVIDIEVAKEIMKEEDEIDREVRRKIRLEKKRARMDKERGPKKNKKAKEADQEDNDAEDDLDETTAAYIDELPDPDEVYGNKNSEDEGDSGDDKDYNDGDSDENDNDEDDKPSKRIRLASSSEDEIDEDFELPDNEHLALQLLRS